MNKFFCTLLIACFGLQAQTITTVAGSSTWTTVKDVAVDAEGNLLVADAGRHMIYRVDRLGAATTIAGTGTIGFSGDGGPANQASLREPVGIAVGPDGSIFIADYGNHRVRRIGMNGLITTVAGNGSFNFSGDGGPATAAGVGNPTDVVVDRSGNLFIATGNRRIRRVSTNGTITTFAGIGTSASSGDDGPALLASLDPGQMFLAADGSLYFADDGDTSPAGNKRLRRVGPDGIVRAVAGTGSSFDGGDGGPALQASFRTIDGVAVDAAGNVFTSSNWGNSIRKIDTNGIITTYAGSSRLGFAGDGGPAIAAQINGPSGLTLDRFGNLLFTDTGNQRVRRIAPPAGPVLRSVAPSFMGRAWFSSNAYLELYGENFSTVTRTWTGTDFQNGIAPTRLNGVSVEVNSRPAFIYFISPNQININTPDDAATGPVNIRVTTPNGTSEGLVVRRERISPTLQTVPQFRAGNRQYVVAQTADFARFVGPLGLVANVPFGPARVGETLILFALGCGPTAPGTAAGQAAASNAPLSLPFQLRIGNRTAEVRFGGVVAGTIGLYQFNVVVPDVPAGDQPIELVVDGIANGQELFLSVGDR